jgi:hypothetical protein
LLLKQQYNWSGNKQPNLVFGKIWQGQNLKILVLAENNIYQKIENFVTTN